MNIKEFLNFRKKCFFCKEDLKLFINNKKNNFYIQNNLLTITTVKNAFPVVYGSKKYTIIQEIDINTGELTVNCLDYKQDKYNFLSIGKIASCDNLLSRLALYLDCTNCYCNGVMATYVVLDKKEGKIKPFSSIKESFTLDIDDNMINVINDYESNKTSIMVNDEFSPIIETNLISFTNKKQLLNKIKMSITFQ